MAVFGLCYYCIQLNSGLRVVINKYLDKDVYEVNVQFNCSYLEIKIMFSLYKKCGSLTKKTNFQNIIVLFVVLQKFRNT